MKVKQAKSIDLKANDVYTIKLNDGVKNGDTVARELIFSYDGDCIINNGMDLQQVIYCADLSVDTYGGGGALVIIPCEGLDNLIVEVQTDGTLNYKILV